ncbi:MAG: hypothetical protein QG622_180 [Actinomycetota bacterium]|nr:hypothetical protein [Actinomycetota bacterium]
MSGGRAAGGGWLSRMSGGGVPIGDRADVKRKMWVCPVAQGLDLLGKCPDRVKQSV